MNINPPEQPPVLFELVLKAEPGLSQAEAERHLKAMLKRAGRSWHFQCKSAKVVESKRENR